MLVTIAVGVVGYAVQAGLMLAAGLGAGVSGTDPAAGLGSAALISLPVGFVVNAGILAAFPPTSGAGPA